MATMQPKIDANPQLQSYYARTDTIFWFETVLGGARHFGYYEKDTKNPFPISRALERMEEQLLQALRLPSGSKILDAGCGSGHVSRFMARQGMNVTAIDVVPRHITLANEAGKGDLNSSKEGSVDFHLMDYHHLEAFDDAVFDGVYTIESFVHATDPDAVLAGFFRITKPGGRIAMHEYDNAVSQGDKAPENLKRSMKQINEGFCMPMHEISSPGALKNMLEKAGFIEVEVKDLSENVRPMTRLNYMISIVPYWLVTLLRLERYFINAVAGVNLHRSHGLWRYLQITAKKPDRSTSS